MNKTYEQLLDVRAYLKTEDEFMCIVANELALDLAQEAIQASVREVGEFCLQGHWETLKGYSCDQVSYTDPEYQEFRKQWLDALIEEYAV